MPGAKSRKSISRKSSRSKKRGDYGIFLIFFIICITAFSVFFFRDIIKNTVLDSFSRKAGMKASKKLIIEDEKLYYEKLIKQNKDIKNNTGDVVKSGNKDEYNTGDRDYLNKIINKR